MKNNCQLTLLSVFVSLGLSLDLPALAQGNPPGEFLVMGGANDSVGTGCYLLGPEIVTTASPPAVGQRIWFEDQPWAGGAVGSSYRAIAAPGILFSKVDCFDNRDRYSTYCVINAGRSRFVLTNLVFCGPPGATVVTDVTFTADVTVELIDHADYRLSGTLPITQTTLIASGIPRPSVSVYRVTFGPGTFALNTPQTFEMDLSTRSVAESVGASAHYGRAEVLLQHAGGPVFSLPPGYCVNGGGIADNQFTAPCVRSFSPASGVPGNCVVIEGCNLGGATTVVFNGVPANFTVEANDRIIASVPATATTGPITVTTPTGTIPTVNEFIVEAPLLYEPFDYPNIGEPVTVNTPSNWNLNGSGANDLTLAAGSLSYSGLAASVGNSATNGGAGLNVRRKFNIDVDNGMLYFSALFRINDLGYGIWDGAATQIGGLVATNGVSRLTVQVKSNSPSGYIIGLQKGGTTPTFSPTEYHTGDTVLLVGRYDFTVLPNAVSLWINPSASTFGAASEPATGQLWANAGADGFAINRFNMRQNTAATVPADVQWDELRIGGSWASVTPPSLTCSAGPDFSVNEGDLVTLSGSPANIGALLWTQLSGTPVTLSDPTGPNPIFTAPLVAIGGETLTFKLTRTTACNTSEDTVNITVVNLNHIPVADAGPDQTVAELAPVTLHGENSFDCDNDIFDLEWVQISGPTVTLNDPTSDNPTFTAPEMTAGGDPGVVATLVFQLQVSDSYAPDTTCSGFSSSNTADTVEIKVTNVDNAPNADAGTDQTVDEGAGVLLHAENSSDPDSDELTFAWTQVGGPPVVLTDSSASNPSFAAPAVGPGGTNLTFQLLADDGFGGTDLDQVVIHVQNANDPPIGSLARPTLPRLWPPNHGLVEIGIIGVSDPENDPVTISITRVTQDEPTQSGVGGDTAPDAVIQGSTVFLRAERSTVKSNGRVYRINFTAMDGQGGSSSGSVVVFVPHDRKDQTAVDDGQNFDSTQ